MRAYLLSLSALVAVLMLSAFSWFQTNIWVPELPETPFNYANIQAPQHLAVPPLQALINTPDTNPITDAGATLGRVLFYERSLSENRTIACGSCHLQEFAFTDTATFSAGFDGGFTGRNSMALTNAKYYQNGRFFWDERALSLEHQVLQPIQDQVEMGLTLDTVEARIAALNYYPDLFEAAYGDDSVSSERISLALAQFVRSIVSYDTKYDAGRAQMPPGPPGQDTFPNFTPEENLGMQLFFAPDRGNCAACHQGDMFVQPVPRNNGLDTFYTDLGLYNVTGDPGDIGKFKMPSLRNVGLTAPYMHDGRFQTLEEVIDHYDHGVQPHVNLDPRLLEPPAGGGPPAPNAPPRQLNFTPEEQAALVAFLHTLTDTTVANAALWSDPFVEEELPPLAADDLYQAASIRLYPNPATDQIQLERTTVSLAAAQLLIMDLQGRLVQQTELLTQTSQSISLSNLSPGLYLVQVQEAGELIWQDKLLIR